MSCSSEQETSTKRVLFVGLCCLDIVNVCKSFPEEDTDQRVLDQRWQRGGNACNNTTVFSHLIRWIKREKSGCQLNVEVEFIGTMAADFEAMFMRDDFKKHNIRITNVKVYDDEEMKTPCSCVLINSQNGSRTIVFHHKNLPELPATAFTSLELSRYSWIHFEGRNIDQVKEMIDFVSINHPNIVVSLNMERKMIELNNLMAHEGVKYVFLEKKFAKFMGCANVDEAIGMFSSRIGANSCLICPWAECGAKGFDAKTKQIVSSPASVTSLGIHDTLGAGDTFLASVVFALCILDKNLTESIEFGCRVACVKCGLPGYDGISQFDQYFK